MRITELQSQQAYPIRYMKETFICSECNGNGELDGSVCDNCNGTGEEIRTWKE